jgi:hypothetical protein
MQTLTRWWVGAATGLVGLSCTQLTVVPVAVAEVTVVPAQVEAEVAQQVRLDVVLRASTGEQISGRAVDWSTTDATIAVVDSLGAVTALSPGQTIIAATVEGRLGTALVLVGEPPPVGPPPSRPTNLNANDDGPTVIDVEWSDNSENEARFEVQRRTKDGDWSLIQELSANTTRYRDSGLQPETEYEYRVRACNATGCSRYSNRDKTKTDDD